MSPQESLPSSSPTQKQETPMGTMGGENRDTISTKRRPHSALQGIGGCPHDCRADGCHACPSAPCCPASLETIVPSPASPGRRPKFKFKGQFLIHVCCFYSIVKSKSPKWSRCEPGTVCVPRKWRHGLWDDVRVVYGNSVHS